MRFGFHISIAGGLGRVRQRAEQVQSQTIQLFTRSPRGWGARRIAQSEAVRFRDDVRESGIAPVFVHAPYLPNLATRNPELRRRTVAVLAAEMRRCRRLGVGHLVVHAGRAGEGQAGPALRRVAAAVSRVLDLAAEPVMLLLENTAGMGSEVGYRFEQLRDILGMVRQPDRVGVALDTAHLLAAGYDIANQRGLDRTLREFDGEVGFSRLHLLHVNDSKAGLGSRLDRHWHIGEGRIGRDGFRAIVNHPLLRHLPAIMETPKKTVEDYIRNLRAIRRLVE